MTAIDQKTALLYRNQPWRLAPPRSMWEATGSYGTTGDTFTDCLAMALPHENGGTPPGEEPLFTIYVNGDVPRIVRASSITSATPLVLVYANEPDRAYHEQDQPLLDYYRSAS